MEKKAVWLYWLEVVLIFAAFALVGAFPVPDTNEAHYIGKAAAYWNPDYVRNDFFLDSPDSHTAFYWTFGWLTLCLPLSAAAWVGRAALWFGLAAGWKHMVSPIFPKFGPALLSAVLFFAIQTHFRFAGEWVVGGVEAKVFAYVLLFFALGEVIRNHWNRAWILLGFAALFHVLVGGWSILALGLTWLFIRFWSPDEKHVPTLRSMLPGLIVAFLLSLPALIPGLLMNRGVEPTMVAAANRLYVVERLPHHLLLSHIAVKNSEAMLHLGVMFLLLNLLCTRPRLSNGEMHLRLFTYATLVFVTCGWIINMCIHLAPDTVCALLRFYWYRLADVMLPLGIAVLVVEFCVTPPVFAPIETESRKERAKIEARREAKERWHKRGRAVLLLGLVACSVAALGFFGHKAVTQRAPRSCSGAAKLESWLDICAVAREKSEPTDVFVVPYTTRTFTWYARRPVVGVWKDIPQDAKNLCEWWDRMQVQFYGIDPADPTGAYGRLRGFAKLPPGRLDRVKELYGAKYLVATAGDVLPDRELLYKNAHFALWRL